MTTEMSVEEVLARSEENFRSLVDDDVRDLASAEVMEVLRRPEVLDRWHDTLAMMLISIEAQLAAKTAETKAKIAEFRLRNQKDKILQEEASSWRWRAKALRFKSGLNEKMAEVKQLQRTHGQLSLVERATEERNAEIFRRIQLEKAIQRHRDTLDDDPSDTDEELWRVLK